MALKLCDKAGKLKNYFVSFVNSVQRWYCFFVVLCVVGVLSMNLGHERLMIFLRGETCLACGRLFLLFMHFRCEPDETKSPVQHFLFLV